MSRGTDFYQDGRWSHIGAVGGNHSGRWQDCTLSECVEEGLKWLRVGDWVVTLLDGAPTGKGEVVRIDPGGLAAGTPAILVQPEDSTAAKWFRRKDLLRIPSREENAETVLSGGEIRADYIQPIAPRSDVFHEFAVGPHDVRVHYGGDGLFSYLSIRESAIEPLLKALKAKGFETPPPALPQPHGNVENVELGEEGHFGPSNQIHPTTYEACQLPSCLRRKDLEQFHREDR